MEEQRKQELMLAFAKDMQKRGAGEILLTSG